MRLSAWTGRFMIELIEPNPELAGIYGDAIPAQDQTAQFHHLGFAVPDKAAFDSVAAQLKARDIPIVAQGEFGDLRFLYADARPELGHYLEYICVGDTARAMFAQVPAN